MFMFRASSGVLSLELCDFVRLDESAFAMRNDKFCVVNIHLLVADLVQPQ